VGRADEECGGRSRSAADDVIYDALLTETVAERGWSRCVPVMPWANGSEDKRSFCRGQ